MNKPSKEKPVPKKPAASGKNKYASQERYAQRKGKHTFGVVVYRDLDPDVYEKLMSMDSVSAYLKSLVRADIAKEKGE